MKKVVIGVLTILFGIAGNSLAQNAIYKAFTPSGGGKSVIIQSGTKKLKYYAVSKGTSFGFDVTGPAKVKIRTRAAVKPGIKDINYEIQVWEADKMAAGRKVKTIPSVLRIDNQDIGMARDLFFKVSNGKHSYRMWVVSDNADQFYTRFYKTPRPRKATGFNISKPDQFTEEVNLVTGKKTLPYYLVDGNGGVSLNVVGPVQLKIYCRANFNQNMIGKVKYTLGMFENGKEAGRFEGAAKKTGSVQFKELADLVPSTLVTHIIDVPSGNHSYQFKKIDSASPSLAVRFKVGKVDTGMLP